MNAVEWRVSPGRVDYAAAVQFMDATSAAIRDAGAPEMVWLLEHPPLYTGGVSAKEADLLDPRWPVYRSARGGQYTYHGPGQRVAYVMLDLARRGRDVRCYVRDLERWIIAALACFGVEGRVIDGRVGVWVTRRGPGFERTEKIAAIGVKIRRWVSLHGVALNVEPDLSHFSGIVPCGLRDAGVTSLVDLGHTVTMAEVDDALRAAFKEVFGPIAAAGAPALP